MTLDEAWQLENVLTGTYVDSTRVDHPGVVETDDYRYQITDISVEEPDHALYRAAKRFGNAARFTVETTIAFDEMPDPDDVRDHPYMRGVGGRLEQDGEDTLRITWGHVPDRRRYDQRLTYFRDAVEDLLGG